MSTTSDTFSQFVDVVADGLDAPDTSAEAIARRAHLSRFHFDRLVAAAAGEPPGAFRRRIRLERAAHQLVSSRRGVLDIAVDAGYSSHEAFSRAFARAYGAAPTAWRRNAGPPEVFTYGGMLAHVLAFGATRRTLVVGALATAGSDDLGAGDPMRWVAENT